jgi:hypothetical protein
MVTAVQIAMSGFRYVVCAWEGHSPSRSQAIEYFHNENFIDENDEPVIADFDFSKRFEPRILSAFHQTMDLCHPFVMTPDLISD